MNETLPPGALSIAGTDPDATQPPVSVVTTGNLRFETPAELYAAIPQLAAVTQLRPDLGEDAMAYLWRLRTSKTPEEAISFAAFAPLPQMAIWWGHECLRLMPETLDASDHDMMEMIADWVGTPTAMTRHRVMKEALFAPRPSSAVTLGLAVGWSGGSIAPNDPSPVAVHRCPRAINSAILSALAKVETSRRQHALTKLIDVAESLFRVY